MHSINRPADIYLEVISMTWLEELCNDYALGINANYPPREFDHTHDVLFFSASKFDPFENDFFDICRRDTNNKQINIIQGGVKKHET
jgi:hypothetical protein